MCESVCLWLYCELEINAKIVLERCWAIIQNATLADDDSKPFHSHFNFCFLNNCFSIVSIYKLAIYIVRIVCFCCCFCFLFDSEKMCRFCIAPYELLKIFACSEQKIAIFKFCMYICMYVYVCTSICISKVYFVFAFEFKFISYQKHVCSKNN